jgi:hypothetical protein
VNHDCNVASANKLNFTVAAGMVASQRYECAPT